MHNWPTALLAAVATYAVCTTAAATADASVASVNTTITAGTTSVQSITTGVWHTLNITVGGRLGIALPLGLPCFSAFEGKVVERDAAACQTFIAGYTQPTYRVVQPAGYMYPQWETCQTTGETCVLDGANPANPLAWTTANCSQGSVPPFYIDVRAATDVQAAYAFAALTGVNLVVKNTGHDFKGRSSGKNSLALWTHNLKGMTYSAKFVPSGCPASKSYTAMTIGAGVGWQEVYNWAETQGITAIGGYHQTVGASGGWLLGGGHSILSPVYGLGVDRVVQFKIVTPDGKVRVVNECQGADLFWALRGGGGSAFGVVLESSSAVVPSPVQLAVASIHFTANGTASQAGWLQLVVDAAERWGNEGWGGHIGPNNLINVTPLLSLAEAQASLADVAAYAQAYSGTVVIEMLPTWNQFFQKYVLAAQAPVGPQRVLGSRLMPTALFQTPGGRAQVLGALVDMLPHGSPGIIVGTPFLYNASIAGGKTAVHPAWYSSLWHLTMNEGWEYNATLADKVAAYTDVSTQVVDNLRAIAPDSGAYFNEGDVYEKNHRVTYWGDNYAQLLAIKNKYDALHLLDCWQCVGWKGTSDRRYKCYPDILSPN